MRGAAFGLACLILAAFVLGGGRCEVEAQGAPAVPLPDTAWASDPGLVCAIVGTNEAGIDGLADHLAICEYIRRNARRAGLSIPAYAFRRFRRALALPGARHNRHWIANLSRSLDAPAEWPEARQAWAERQGQWTEALARADAFLAGETPAPCSPSTWGSPLYDAEEIEALIAGGARVISCGLTRNVFLRFR